MKRPGTPTHLQAPSMASLPAVLTTRSHCYAELDGGGSASPVLIAPTYEGVARLS